MAENTLTKKIKVVHAFNRSLITELPVDDAKSLEAKILRAKKVFDDRQSWLKAHQRIAILKQSAELLGKRHGEFALLIAKEGGKPLKDADVEVTRAIDGLLNAAEELRNFFGQQIPMGLTPASEGRTAFTQRQPIGIVAAVSAFNHPLNLIVHQVAPAVAVGCPVIIKPASTTPLSCIEFVKVLYQAGLPEAWCQTLVTEDNSLAQTLVTDDRISFMSFIGSAKVGWYLRSQLARGTRCALEHGGVAPVIVDQSANLNKAIEGVTKGGYYHAGQVCVSVQRVFVHKNIFQSFVDKFSERVQQLKVGDPTDKTTEVGPLIHPKETDRVLTWVDEALKEGAKLIGGGRLSETTLKPAILINPSLDSKISTQEVFGPVTCVYEYEDIDEALKIANSLPFAFQSSVYSEDMGVALKAAEHFEASAVMINDHTAFRTDWMPFAGLKHSGYGVGGIPYSMKDMTYEKMIVFKQGD